METFLTIVHILVCIVLILIILMQTSKSEGLGGIINTGSTQTFFSRNKGRSFEGKLEKFTALFMVLFIITSITLNVIK